MVDFYHYDAKDFNGGDLTTTIATGPVVINDKGDFLLHKAESTGKFQFSGGRLDENKNCKENAIYRPLEDLGVEVELENREPFVVVDDIMRNEVKEVLILIHYLAKLKEGSKPMKGDFGWFSLANILELEKKGELSSPNIVLACRNFIS
jgi:ADP-ribose pyrophosphatase YjhB (NUDIX family)